MYMRIMRVLERDKTRLYNIFRLIYVICMRLKSHFFAQIATRFPNDITDHCSRNVQVLGYFLASGIFKKNLLQNETVTLWMPVSIEVFLESEEYLRQFFSFNKYLFWCRWRS